MGMSMSASSSKPLLTIRPALLGRGEEGKAKMATTTMTTIVEMLMSMLEFVLLLVLINRGVPCATTLHYIDALDEWSLRLQAPQCLRSSSS